MLDDLDNLLGSVDRKLDPLKVSSLIDSATQLACTNPLSGLSSVVSTGSVIDKLMDPASELVAGPTPPKVDLASSLSSLSALKVPYETLTGLEITEPYRGTISSLASVAGVADNMISALTIPPLSDSFLSEGLSAGAPMFATGFANELGAAHAVITPYVASAASLYSLESSLADLRGYIADAAVLPGIGLDSVGYLQDSVASLSLAVQTTWDALREDTTIWERASLSMLQTPALELYTAVHAAGAVTLLDDYLPDRDEDLEDAIHESVDGFETRLSSLDHELVEPYRGAIAAIKRGGEDWQRHSMTSLRELTMHVLHRLAPDDDVMKVATDSDLHDGRPTRKATLRYVFAAVAGPELGGFFEADMKAAVELFDLLNAGTHKLGNRATPHQLHYLRGRVVGLIGSMLAAQGY